MGVSAGRRLYGLYLKEMFRRLRRKLAMVRVRLYRMSVRVPDRLIVAPTDLRPLDSFVAEEIMEGRFPLAGRELDTNGVSPFFLELPSRAFADRLHSFSWLRHLRCLKTAEASDCARTIVNQWLSTHGRIYEGIAWEDDVVVGRLIAWLSHSPVLLNGAENHFYRRFARSLMVHGHFLERMHASALPGETRLRIRVALAMLSLVIPNSAAQVRRAADALDREIEAQILADGGHVSRNPRVTLDLLLDLLPLRQTYMNLGHDLPTRLIPGIDRMYPALRFFRHQDGDLALFNGATATRANELMSVLRYDETDGQPFKALPHMQFQRLTAGNTVIIADAGLPFSLALSRQAHAGFLSFEMSAGRHRFIVNSGAPRFASVAYRQMARSTAAHSTLVLNETSSARLMPSPFLGPIFAAAPDAIRMTRGENANGDDCLTLSHDGYRQSFGLTHHREIRLSSDGNRISGRDYLARAESRNSSPTGGTAVIRFHVHPAIDLIQAGHEAVILKAPDGDAWIFSVEGGEAVISEDIFFADPSGLRASEQIEVTFSLFDRMELDWQFQRQK